MYMRMVRSSGYRTKNGEYWRYAVVSTPADHPATTLEKLDRVCDLSSVLHLVPDRRYPSIAEIAEDVARAANTRVGSIRYYQYLAERNI